MLLKNELIQKKRKKIFTKSSLELNSQKSITCGQLFFVRFSVFFKKYTVNMHLSFRYRSFHVLLLQNILGIF